jgi:hypothetical protein
LTLQKVPLLTGGYVGKGTSKVGLLKLMAELTDGKAFGGWFTGVVCTDHISEQPPLLFHRSDSHLSLPETSIGASVACRQANRSCGQKHASAATAAVTIPS